MPFSTLENDLASRLAATGLSSSGASLAIALATRLGARPRAELIDIAAQYPHLGSRDSAESAVRELEACGWLLQDTSYATVLTHQASDLRDRIASRLGDSGVAEQLHQLRSAYEGTIRVVGPMHDDAVYQEYRQRLMAAERSIDLPMVATSPNLEVVNVLRDRAEHGVRIRILLAAPTVVAELRGAQMQQVSADRIGEWVRHCTNRKTMKVRVSHNIDDMLMSSSVCIDGTILRFDVHDPVRQQSLQGVLFEAASPSAFRLNIIALFEAVFSDAWRHAATTGRVGPLGSLLARHIELPIAVLALAVAGIFSHFHNDTAQAVAIGVGATVLAEKALRFARARWWT